MADDVVQYANERAVDLLVLSETHMPAGEPADVPGFDLVWEVRQRTVGRAPSGGVAFALVRGPTSIVSVVVQEGCEQADVTWIRVDYGDRSRPLYVAAVYLPPEGPSCCSGCGSGSCSRSHIDTALAYLEESTARFSSVGDVLVLGDFNVQAEKRPVTRRWSGVTQALVREDLCTLANPTAADGSLANTRRDPGTQRESVLDLVLTGVANVCVGSAVGDPTTQLSDHYPILVTLQRVSGDNSLPDHIPPSYGFTSGVPSHLRQKPSVLVSRKAPQLQEYQRIVDARVAALPVCGDDVDGDVTRLERALIDSAYEVGLCTRPHVRDPAVRVFALHQRQLEAARRRLAVVVSISGDHSHEALELGAYIQRLEQRQVSELPARRREQRRRRALRRQRENDDLTQLWTSNEIGLLSQRMGDDQRGRLQQQSRQPLIPLPVRQETLWKKEQHLRNKYGTAPAVLGDFTELVGDVQVPTVGEIAVAVKQLNGHAAAIGVPLFPLRWASTPALLQHLHALFDGIWRRGVVPASFGVVEAVAIPKPGSPDYRVIGVGSALSRLFRLIIYNRVLAQVRPLLDPMQFGFLPGKSTEDAAFLASSGTACAQAAGNTVETVFLDIAGAYPTTPWDVVMTRFKAMGIPADIRRLTHNYYKCQRMFVKVGRLVSGWVTVTIGLTEGDPMSPLTFVIVIDEGVRRLHSAVLFNGANLGIPTLDGGQLTCVWYADDGRLFALTPEGMVVLLSVCEEVFGTTFRFRFNAAPTKSASQRYLPFGKRDRAQAVRAVRNTAPYTLQGSVLPTVDVYKHVGIMTSPRGKTASQAAQTAKL